MKNFEKRCRFSEKRWKFSEKYFNSYKIRKLKKLYKNSEKLLHEKFWEKFSPGIVYFKEYIVIENIIQKESEIVDIAYLLDIAS